MELLSPGKKLRNIRNKFKIKQSEITGGEITRELISIIENDRCRVMPHVANIIATNINKICNERNIDFVLEPSYLLEDVKTQALKIADEYIELLDSYDEFTSEIKNTLKNIEGFLEKYDVDDKKIILYEKIGDIYIGLYKYNKSYDCYVKALESNKEFLEDKDLFQLFKKFGVNCIHLARYKEAIEFNNLALSYENSISDESKQKVYFNNVLCYFYMKDYKKSLEGIEIIKLKFTELVPESLFKLNSLKSNCLVELKNYSEAIEIDKNLLKNLDTDDIKNRIMVLGNMLDIYITTKDISNTRKYIFKLENEIRNWEEKSTPFFLPTVYCQLEYAAILIGDSELSEKYFNILIELCKINKNMYAIKACLEQHIELLNRENSEEEINILKSRLLELIALGS